MRSERKGILVGSLALKNRIRMTPIATGTFIYYHETANDLRGVLPSGNMDKPMSYDSALGDDVEVVAIKDRFQ
jgi:hypothetical protein